VVVVLVVMSRGCTLRVVVRRCSTIATISWLPLVVTVYSSLTWLIRRPQGVVLLGGLVVVGRMHRVPEALDADYERCLLFTALACYLLMQSLQRRGPLQTILLLSLRYRIHNI
jgi:hypothetical protein